MKKNILLLSMMLQSYSLQSSASSYTMENAALDLYDSEGTHFILNYEMLGGAIDFDNQTGFFDFARPPSHNITVYTDIVEIDQWGGVSGSGDTESHDFTWTTNRYWAGTELVSCNISLGYNGCIDENESGLLLFDQENYSYDFTLSEGQFSLGLFMDWSTNEDIPTLNILQSTHVDINGVITFESVDSDNDGAPGHQMLTAPFVNQTVALSGVLVPVSAVPVPASLWLFVSGLLGLVGFVRKT